MNIFGQVGPVGPIATGANVIVRQGNLGEVSVSELQGKYYEQAFRGNSFYCCNSAAQALSLTGTTTYTGLVLYNNIGSGKNLAIKTAIFTPTIAETGVGGVLLFSQAIAASIPTLTTTNVANGAVSTLLNGNASTVAKVASSCTLAANPIFLRPLFSTQFGTAVGLNTLAYKDDIAGELIVPPGAGIGFCGITTAITGIGYISWDEVSTIL